MENVKKKLNLEDIKVKSFVTANANLLDTIRIQGGDTNGSCWHPCTDLGGDGTCTKGRNCQGSSDPIAFQC